jgi:hypothetical protein
MNPASFSARVMTIFLSDTQPPGLPSEPFKLELTSRYLPGHPSVVFNELLKFLALQKGVLSKVNISKYTIRYTAFDEDFSHCKSKIFGYTTGVGYVLEFQRRGGSTVVFNELYSLWAKVTPTSSIARPCLLLKPANNKVLTPTLDMLRNPCDHIQAEACACLASWICRGELDEQELTGLEDIFRDLSGHKDIALSYPAKCILEHM